MLWRGSRPCKADLLMVPCPLPGDRAHSGVAPEAFARYQFACLPGGGAGEPLARPPQPPGGAGAYLTVSVGAGGTCRVLGG